MCWKPTYKYNKVSIIMIFQFNWIKWLSRLPWLELLSFSQVLWQGTSTLLEIYYVDWYSVKYKMSHAFGLLLLSRLVFFLKNKLGLLQLSGILCVIWGFYYLEFYKYRSESVLPEKQESEKGGKKQEEKALKICPSSWKELIF